MNDRMKFDDFGEFEKHSIPRELSARIKIYICLTMIIMMLMMVMTTTTTTMIMMKISCEISYSA